MASTVPAPLGWIQIKEIVQRGKSDAAALGALGRCGADNAIYQEHCNNLKQEWATVGDHMRAKLFGAPTKVNADGKREVDDERDTTSGACRILVMRNEFPYSFAPADDISHVNIWCSSQPLEAEVIERLITERLPCEECAWFVNPPQLQSVRTLWHCHVMARNLKDSARLSLPGNAELFDPVAYMAGTG